MAPPPAGGYIAPDQGNKPRVPPESEHHYDPPPMVRPPLQPVWLVNRFEREAREMVERCGQLVAFCTARVGALARYGYTIDEEATQHRESLEAYGNGDYGSALARAHAAAESARAKVEGLQEIRRLEKRLEQELPLLTESLEEATRAGLETKDFTVRLSVAKTKAATTKGLDSLRTLVSEVEALGEGIEDLHQAAQQLVKKRSSVRELLTEVADLLDQYRKVLIDPQGISTGLTEAEALYQKDQLDEAEYRGGVLSAELDKAIGEYERARKLVEETHVMIDRIAQTGVDVTASRALHDQAAQRLAAKDYAAIAPFRTRIKTILEESVVDAKRKSAAREQAQMALGQLSAAMDDINQLGLSSKELTTAHQLAKQAWQMSDFPTAADQASRGATLARQLAEDFRQVRDQGLQVRALLEQVRQWASVREPQRLFDEATAAALTLDFRTAADRLVNAQRQLHRLVSGATAHDFDFRFSPAYFTPNILNRCQLELRNVSQLHVRNVTVRLNGPVEVMRMKDLPMLQGESTQALEIALKPTDAGELPLDVEVRAIDARTGAAIEWHRSVWLSSGSPPAGSAEPLEEHPPKREGDAVDPFTVEQVFLIHGDGRLLGHVATSELATDTTLMSSMLVAIQGFVQESFKSEGGLGSFAFGEKAVVLERGRVVLLAATVDGTTPVILRERMSDVISKFEGTFAGIIDSWDGDTRIFGDIEPMLRPILTLHTMVPQRKTKEEVKLLSGLEFFQGYVRLKIASVNKTATTITDSTLRMTYNKKNLRFDHIEPDYQMDGTSVELGAVKPGEKKTVAYYLDPLICMESHIDCTLTYLDYRGQLQHVDMKRRPVDIVCPIFYTPNTVNIAMLKRLITDFAYTDNRMYLLPKAIPLVTGHDLLKEAIEGHHVKFVREFREESPSTIIETWYYGKVAQGGEEIVIMAKSRGNDDVLEVLVACSNLASLTGLLAELGQNLKNRLIERDLKSSSIELITDRELKTHLESSGLLLEKYTTGASAEGIEVSS